MAAKNSKNNRNRTGKAKNVKRLVTVYPNPITQSSPIGTGAGIIALIAIFAAIAAFITPAGNGFIDFFSLHGLYAGFTWVFIGVASAGIAWYLANNEEMRGKL
jgi:hypothetical protein